MSATTMCVSVNVSVVVLKATGLTKYSRELHTPRGERRMLCASLRVESLFLYPLTRSLRPVELDVESVRTFRSKMLGFLALLASLKPELAGCCKMLNCPSDVWQRSRALATFSAVCASANPRPQTSGNQSEKQVHCDCSSTITPPVTALVPSFARLSGGCSTKPVGKHLSRTFSFFHVSISQVAGSGQAVW